MELDIIEIITVNVTLRSAFDKPLISAHAALCMAHTEKYKSILASPKSYLLRSVNIESVGDTFMDEFEMQDYTVRFTFFKH